ncbi:MAG: ribosome maturation factor RimM [Muribaculaceae bacterium]|nr:ribosome maturation factor RimM [Muribaculaceae bacterium]
MITLAELVSIGKFGKPHGVKGEINLLTEIDVDIAELKCIVADMDGIYVPFFINTLRERGNGSYLATIDRMDSEDKVSQMVNKEIYALRNDEALANATDACDDEEGMYASDLIGYTIVSDQGSIVGEIVDVDDSTENILFVVETPGRETNYLIPVATEFIDDIIPETHTLMMTLPEGLLDQ